MTLCILTKSWSDLPRYGRGIHDRFVLVILLTTLPRRALSGTPST
jgi:hypothetical protein